MTLLNKLTKAQRLLHRSLERALQSQGVSVEQWRVLSALGRKGGQSMGELAQNGLMNHPALTKLADRLVADGLIHRVPDPSDQRRVLVHLTQRGIVKLHQTEMIADRHQNEIELTFGKSKTAALDILVDELSESQIDKQERLASG